MNKLQYLENLEKSLKSLPKEETNDIINDFKEYFEVGIESSLITSEQIKTNKSFGTEEVDKIVINAVSPNIKILPAGALSSTSVLLKFPLIFPLEEF